MIYSNLRTSLPGCLQGTWEACHVTCKVVYGGCNNVINVMLFYYRIFESLVYAHCLEGTPCVVGVIDGYAEQIAR